MKEDALWLSQEAKIDEISALRIVVEECQSRAHAQLLGCFSNEELVGMQDSADQSQSSVPVALLSQAADAEAIQRNFNTQDSRRLRLLRIYLSERHYLIKCVNYLLQHCIYKPLLESEPGRAKEREEPSIPTEKIGRTLVQQILESGGWILDCIKAIDANVKNVNDGSGWYKDDNGREAIEIEWNNAQIAEATQITEIVFQIIDTTENVISAAAVLAWLRLVDGCDFFQLRTVTLPISLALPSRNRSDTLANENKIGRSANPCIDNALTSHYYYCLGFDSRRRSLY